MIYPISHIKNGKCAANFSFLFLLFFFCMCSNKIQSITFRKEQQQQKKETYILHTIFSIHYFDENILLLLLRVHVLHLKTNTNRKTFSFVAHLPTVYIWTQLHSLFFLPFFFVPITNNNCTHFAIYFFFIANFMFYEMHTFDFKTRNINCKKNGFHSLPFNVLVTFVWPTLRCTFQWSSAVGYSSICMELIYLQLKLSTILLSSLNKIIEYYLRWFQLKPHHLLIDWFSLFQKKEKRFSYIDSLIRWFVLR